MPQDVAYLLVERLPLDRLLLETDSPVLGPEAGVRNEPVNVRISLEAIASLKEVETDQAAETIYANTLRLFPRLAEEITT